MFAASQGAAFFEGQMDGIAERIELMRKAAAEKARSEQQAALERRKAQWASIRRDDGLSSLLVELRASGLEPKPVYVLMRQDNPTTKPGNYRMALIDGMVTNVTVRSGFQRVL